MALNPESDDLYKRIAATLAQNKQTPSQAAGVQRIAPSKIFEASTPAPLEEREQDFSLGQGIIDVLSSGTYLTAGMGRKIGENVEAARQGSVGAQLDMFNPLSLIAGGVSGIADRRTWSENLADWGVEEGDDTGVLGMNQRDMGGLALDIILDPLWLIPGGAIAAAAKGTSKGVALASGASAAGVKLTESAVKGAQKATENFTRPLLTDNLVTTKTGVEVTPAVRDFFPQTGQKIPIYTKEGLTNLVQGVRYATADQYARLGATKAQRKADKKARKGGEFGDSGTVATNPFDQGPGGIMGRLIKPVDEIDETKPAAEAAVKQAEAVVDNAPAARTVPDVVKDAEAQPKTVQEAIPAQAVRQAAREQLAPAKTAYMTGKGLDDLKIDFDAVEVSPMAGDMADVYNRAVSSPNDPEVQAAYRSLVDESREQFRVMEEELGIKVEFVKEDPYNVIGKDGQPVPSSKAMMEDVVNNKRLQIRDSADDFATNPHPLFTVEENNLFRAVHDFFGHAGSGRGFDAAGEEAAWLSHSQMFSPLARRAMTTETRGQNSYYNKFGEFAEQKTFLFPEEYVLAPTQYSALERRVEATNQFIGVKSNALMEFADQLLEDLAMVWTPIKGAKLYKPEDIKQIKSKYEQLTDTGAYAATSPEAKETLKLIDELSKYLLTPGRFASVMRANGANSVVDLLRLGEEALAVNDPKVQELNERALAIFRQALDEPLDATELLESALRMEDRVISQPKPFKPTIWTAPEKANTVTKPDFTEDKLRAFFPDDELLRDPEQLRLAMGQTKLKPGSASSIRQARQQQIIWENFRARNHDILAEVVEREKNAWFETNSQPVSEFFTKMADGTVVGQGTLPTSIPKGTIYTSNGRPMTTLAMLLDNMGSVIQRTGPQVGGLPTTRIVGGEISGRTGRVVPDVAGSPVLREGTTTTVSPSRLSFDPATQTFEKTQEGKKLAAALRKRGREIELDKYPLALQKWVLDQIDGLKSRVQSSGVKDARLGDQDLENLITRLWDESPQLKSRADARKIALLGPDAFAQLSKIPAKQYFIDAPFSRLTGKPDPSGIQRQASAKGTRSEQQIVARDPESGVPIDQTGKPVPEAQAEVVGGTQFRSLTDGGKAYTGRLVGRSGSPAAPQTGQGPQQLAGLQAIRSTIGAIDEAIIGKNLAVSKEQGDFLASVLNTLQIRVAPNATPSKIFAQFKNEALPRFEEIVSRIESAAKIESVAFHAKAIFKIVDEDSISLMKAIEDYDVGELQRQSIKFTDDAMQTIDDTCRVGTRGTAPEGGPAAGNLLNQILGGLS